MYVGEESAKAQRDAVSKMQERLTTMERNHSSTVTDMAAKESTWKDKYLTLYDNHTQLESKWSSLQTKMTSSNLSVQEHERSNRALTGIYSSLLQFDCPYHWSY
jgi:hypothetical protein